MIGFASLTRDGRASFSDKPIRIHQCDCRIPSVPDARASGFEIQPESLGSHDVPSLIYKALLPYSVRSLSRSDAQASRFKYDKDMSDPIPPAGRRGRGQSPSKSRRRRRVCVWARKRLYTYDTCAQRYLGNQSDIGISVHLCIGISQYTDIYISVYCDI